MMLMFAITTALSAGLLFVVQPMVSKTLLPVLGGVPSVWEHLPCLLPIDGPARVRLRAYRGESAVGSPAGDLHLVLAWLGVAALLPVLLPLLQQMQLQQELC